MTKRKISDYPKNYFFLEIEKENCFNLSQRIKILRMGQPKCNFTRESKDDAYLYYEIECKAFGVMVFCSFSWLASTLEIRGNNKIDVITKKAGLRESRLIRRTGSIAEKKLYGQKRYLGNKKKY